MLKDHENSRLSAPRDIADCRASDIGMEEMGECLLSGPNSCKYALPFGYCFLCRHPRLREIILNTRKLDPLAARVRPH